MLQLRGFGIVDNVYFARAQHCGLCVFNPILLGACASVCFSLQELEAQLAAKEQEEASLRSSLSQLAPILLKVDVAEPAQYFSVPISVREDPVRLPVNIGEAASSQVSMPISLASTSVSDTVHLPISIAGESAVPLAFNLQDPEKDDLMVRLEQRLAEKELEEAKLREELKSLAPVSLRLGIWGDDTDLGEMTRAPSEVSLAYNSESAASLAYAKAEVDAAWEAHTQQSNVPALLRSKAELEAKCQLLEGQLFKLHSVLEAVDEDKAAMEQHLETAIKEGDVKVLSGLKERLKASTTFLNARGKALRGSLKRRPTSPNKEEAVSPDAKSPGRWSGAFGKLQRKPNKAAAAAASRGGAAVAVMASTSEGQGSDAPPRLTDEYSAGMMSEDLEFDTIAMRDENQMLMEQLVQVKIRLAETEGENLESKRALLRSREKQLQMLKQMKEFHMTNRTEAAPTTDPSPSSTERRRSYRIGGVDFTLKS
jgi:hypothetical protein